jgi:hypothetical protein
MTGDQIRELHPWGRLSLEERYKDNTGYVQAVHHAAADAVKRGFLLPPDAAALIPAAEASHVLR